MPRRRETDYSQIDMESRPSLSPDARESQMIYLAMDLAEQRLRNGTASSQEVVHFLKLGSARERSEREKLENEITLLKAKTDALKSVKRSEELFEQAVDAMRLYGGHTNDQDVR